MKNLNSNVRIESKQRSLAPEEVAEAKDATMQLIELIAKKIAERLLAKVEQEA